MSLLSLTLGSMNSLFGNLSGDLEGILAGVRDNLGGFGMFWGKFFGFTGRSWYTDPGIFEMSGFSEGASEVCFVFFNQLSGRMFDETSP